MPNHYHLLLRINKPNLSEAMHQLNTTYGKRFNIKYYRKGHVFYGVYRTSMCMDDIHLIASSIYMHLNMHLNPQKAGIVKDASSYRWSSINLYINSEIKSFIDSSFILRIINEDLKKASSTYKTMMIDCSEVEYEDVIENSKAVINFSKAIFKKLLKNLGSRNIKKDFVETEKNIDELIEKFKSRKRRRKPEDKKGAVYLIEQLKSRGYNLTEIARILNLSRNSLYNLTSDVER